MSSPTTKCCVCSFESGQVGIFHRGENFFNRQPRWLCPACATENAEKIYQKVFLGYVTLLATGGLLIFLLPAMSLGSWLLNIALLLFFILVGTIFHEAGHLGAGWLAKFRICSVEIGQGRVIAEARFGRVRWQFRAVLFGGCVHGISRDTKNFRLRESLFICGGPLANVVMIILALWALPLDATLNAGIFKGCAPMAALLLVNGLLLSYSLWPHHFRARQGKLANDALLLWQTWRRPQAEIDQLPVHWYFQEAKERQNLKEPGAAKKWIVRGLRRFPDNYFLLLLQASNLIELKRYSEARIAYIRLLGRYSKSEEFRFICFNNIAYVDLLSGIPDLLEEADICSRLAQEKFPANIYFMGTRGSVLIALEEAEAGLKLLTQALRQSPDRAGQALNACFMGIGVARLGRQEESRALFALARRLDPSCLLLERDPSAPKRC